MSEKIKVAHVIRVFSYGGAEVSLRELFSTSIFQKNLVSDLYILDHKKLGLVPDVKPYVQSVFHYKITSFFFLFEYVRFLKHLSSKGYDIVHMHLPVAGWLGIAGKLFSRKTKFIYTEHTLVSFYSKYNYYLIGLTYGFLDSVISVSEEVDGVIKKEHKGWFYKSKHPVTILNGINTEKFCIPDRSEKTRLDSLVVGLVARFRPLKRLDRWVEVAAEIHKRNKNIQFIMHGDGPAEEALREKISKENLTDVIQLPGRSNETLSAYKQMDIFLLTSDLEGLPLSLMEAMSCGCLPIVHNVGGIKQLDFDRIGYKYNSFDAADIAEKILSYPGNPGKYFTESKRAREFVVRNYSIAKQANEIVILYKQLLA